MGDWRVATAIRVWVGLALGQHVHPGQSNYEFEKGQQTRDYAEDPMVTIVQHY